MIKEWAAATVLKTLRGFVGRWNYEIRRRPSTLVGTSNLELTPSLQMVLSQYMLRNADITFVQIGAFDGRQADPLYQFATRYHWTGVLVEPMPDAFAKLQVAYAHEPQIQLHNVAVAAANGTRKLYHLKRDAPGLPTWAPMLASFDRNVVMRHEAQIPGIAAFVETTDVPCVTLDTLLDRAGLNQFDLLQIDTEGYDYEILKLVDFSRIRPPIINYEHAHLQQDDWDAAIDLLVRNGYRVGIGPYDTVGCLAEYVS